MIGPNSRNREKRDILAPNQEKWTFWLPKYCLRSSTARPDDWWPHNCLLHIYEENQIVWEISEPNLEDKVLHNISQTRNQRHTIINFNQANIMWFLYIGKKRGPYTWWTLLYRVNPTSQCYISLLSGMWNDDQHRNTNMNNKDHLVGQLTNVTLAW